MEAPAGVRWRGLSANIYKGDGTIFESDPRYVLKKVVDKVQAEGYDFQVGPECEFFLFHTDEGGMPTTITHENASYFDLGRWIWGKCQT